ncbi:MAG: DinB family protein [Acidobacteria bacterium]|nr:DinB family protein [Acidobacteriota bacterium]
MKQSFILLMIVVLAFSVQAQSPASSPTPSLQGEERRFLMDYLKRSRQMMHDAVRDVTAEQWTFKPKPFRWSVAECAEHIILTERWLMSEFAAKFGKGDEPAYIFHWRKPKPKASEETLAERRSIDLFIVNDLLDRSKVDTSIPSNAPPEASVIPAGKYRTPEEMLKDFDKQRDETIRIIENLKVDWREHYVYSGWSSNRNLYDGYQYLLRIPAHCERHLMQLWEVKRDANYPRPKVS